MATLSTPSIGETGSIGLAVAANMGAMTIVDAEEEPKGQDPTIGTQRPPRCAVPLSGPPMWAWRRPTYNLIRVLSGLTSFRRATDRIRRQAASPSRFPQTLARYSTRAAIGHGAEILHQRPEFFDEPTTEPAERPPRTPI